MSINWKNKEESAKLVEEVKKKRVEKETPEKNTKKPVKKTQKKKKVSGFKKFVRIMTALLIECAVCAIIVVFCWCVNTIEGYLDVFELTHKQQDLIEELVHEITEIKTQYQAVEVKEVSDREYLGVYKITHYCACKKCCGPNAQGITASGKRVEENKTIAVDPKVIALGSQVYIEGYGYMEAQDTGSAIKGNIIDVYVADHQEALNLGVVYKDVYLMK